MEEKERKLLAVIILVCCLCLLVVVIAVMSENIDMRKQEETESPGQTLMVMSNGTLNLAGQSCAYSIVVDTDTARRYLIIEDSSDSLRVTPLEQPVPEM